MLMLQCTSVAMRVVLMGSKCMRVDVTWYLPLCTTCLSHDTMFKPCLRSVECDLKWLVLLQAAAMMRRLKASCMDSAPHSTSSGTIPSRVTSPAPRYAGLAKHVRLHLLGHSCKDLADAASQMPQLCTCAFDSSHKQSML